MKKNGKSVKSSVNSSKNINKTGSYKKIILLSVIAGLFLLITNSAIWVNREIFNKDRFTSTVTTSITSESSRAAMATNITDKIFTDRPIAKRIAGDFSVKIISGLLDTDQFINVLNVAVERMQVYVTSENQENVTIELGGVKDVITKITAISESLGRDATIDPSNIPESILLINADDIPDLYKIGLAMLWIAPISFIGALILLAYPYIKHWNDNKKILVVQGIIIILISFVGYLVGPLFRPALLAQIRAESRTVIGNLYDAFISTFNNQTVFLTLVGVLMLLVGTAWMGYPHFRSLIISRKK